MKYDIENCKMTKALGIGRKVAGPGDRVRVNSIAINPLHAKKCVRSIGRRTEPRAMSGVVAEGL